MMISEIEHKKGTYVLILETTQDEPLTIWHFGTFLMPEGFYVYAAVLAYYALICYSEAIMRFLVKLSITIVVIIFCTQVGKKFPSLGGLIATMPLTGLIVLVWLYSDNPRDYDLMVKYTRGALWGILPSILFFLMAFICFRKHLSLRVVLLASFGIWLIGAFFHLWFLG